MLLDRWHFVGVSQFTIRSIGSDCQLITSSVSSGKICLNTGYVEFEAIMLLLHSIAKDDDGYDYIVSVSRGANVPRQ